MGHSPAASHGHGHTQTPPDAERSGSGVRWSVLVVLCLAQFMVILDVTVANVALPSIGADLRLSPATIPWVVSAYTLVFGGFLLLGGRLSDIFDRRAVFLAGLAVFTIASVACGLAANGGMLIVSRLVQGAGAAFLSPAALSIITTTFHGADRNKALGAWAAVGGTGSAIGVLVGGALTSGPGWEWAFFINVPVGVAVLAATLRLLPRSAGRGTQGGIDWLGAVLMTTATAAVIYGLITAGHAGWSAPGTYLPIIVGVVLAVAFVLVERSAAKPLVPLGVVGKRTVVSGGVSMLAGAGLLIAGFFLCSLYLQNVAGFSAMQTGLTFLPVALGMVVAVHLCAHGLAHAGWRPIAVIGMVLAAGGFFWLSRISGDPSALGEVLPGFVIAAAGLACMFIVATTSAMHGVDHAEAGLHSGLINTYHEFGASLGIALVAAIAGASVGGAHTTTLTGFQDAFLACAIVAIIVAVIAPVLLPAGKPDSDGPIFAH
ncbi:MFS transporter [Actinokineospora xionganensis]|uniref:MFS transporter n=1 Tax=Actinokineospora xionganensis TaxID=2684470 RepID=UPI001C9BC182|nr:MFS transporter [Actinokineospora xionganensis]